MESAAHVFLGREAELRELRGGLAEALAGHGRLFVVVGDPGIGKTRLADELARHAAEQGARVLWGRCWESGGAPAYWPWVQMLRAYAAAGDATLLAEFRRQLDALTSEAAPKATIATLPSKDPEQERFRLFDATTTLLHQAASRRPLVLILDDLHAADRASLLLLRFVARELRGAALLVVGTYREIEAARSPAVFQLLADVVREGQRLPLRGLNRDDVAKYLAQAAGGEAVAESLVDAVYAATEGHPLFLSQVVRLLVAEQRGQPGLRATRPLRIPEELRAVIRQRLAPLSATAQDVLPVAAVIGREFERGMLERLCSAHRDALSDVLDEAVATGVLQPVAESLGRYAFAHGLIRDTLYDDLPTSLRALHHARIGAALEGAHAMDPEPPLAEIAHHFVQAAAGGTTDEAEGASVDRLDKAIEYARRAAEHAQALLAYEEAAEHYERALQALARREAQAGAGGDTQARRCALLVALSDVQWGAGEIVATRETARRAADTARLLHRQEASPATAALLARAALGFGGRQQRAHVAFDPEALRLLEEALAVLPAADSALRARVLARLAYTLYSVPDSRRRRDELSREAVAIARRLGDGPTLRWVLTDRRWALWAPDTIEERLAITAELTRVAHDSGDTELLIEQHGWRAVDLMERGDRVAVDAELRMYAQRAQTQRRPWYRWYVQRFDGMRALLEGRFAEAERLAEEGFASGRRLQHPDAMLIYGTLILHLRDQQGRLGELEAGIETFVAEYPAMPIWRTTLAYAYAQQGREAEARGEFERLAARDFADVPDDYLRLMSLSMLSLVCASLCDARRAARLYEMLLPYADRCIVVGFGIACLGSAARPLGLLAGTLGRWADAAAHFTRAEQVDSTLGARPLLARTRYEHAHMLLQATRAGASVDPAPAAALLKEARDTAAALGMDTLAESTSRALAELGAAPAAPAPAPPTSAVFRRNGDYWDVAFQSSRFRVKHLLGFTYIAHLLRHPGREFHALDLVDLGGSDTGATVDAGDAGELLDGRARGAYRQRLAELRDELSDAEGANDLGRVERLRSETAALERELARGVGLGGRTRRAGSAAERARVSVTKRIAIARRHIARHAPGLGRFLADSIKTGAFCSYEPDPNRRVDWEL